MNKNVYVYYIFGVHRDTNIDPDLAIDAYFYLMQDDKTVYYSMRSDMVRMVEGGDIAYSCAKDASMARCDVRQKKNGVKFLQSQADRFAENNLLNLPEMNYAQGQQRP